MTKLEEGLALCKDRRYGQAIQVFEQGLQADPGNRELLYEQAKALFKQKQLDHALKNFNSLLEKEPANAELISERAVLFHHQGDNMKALEELNKAAELEPQNPFRYSSRAWIKAAMKDTEGAIADYERAIELDPEDAISLNNKGLLEDQLGWKEASNRSFDRSNAVAGYKPDLSRTLKVQNGEPSDKASVAAPEKTDTNVPLMTGGENNEGKKVSLQQFFGTVRSLFVEPGERKAFWQFLKGKFR